MLHLLQNSIYACYAAGKEDPNPHSPSCKKWDCFIQGLNDVLLFELCYMDSSYHSKATELCDHSK